MSPHSANTVRGVDREAAQLLNPLIGDLAEHTLHLVYEQLDHLVAQLWESDRPEMIAGAMELCVAAMRYECAVSGRCYEGKKESAP